MFRLGGYRKTGTENQSLVEAVPLILWWDDYTYRWDEPFDEMKNEVIDELLLLLDLDKNGWVRTAFIESLGLIRCGNRE